MLPIIKVENLSKRYRIGERRDPYGSLRESLVRAARAPFRRLHNDQPKENTIWALKDVTFEVLPGEVVGVIGRNGAGKSTLLKILSRITEPTSGGVDLYGRVGSLLEVGTGFHPELTGRENIYLNGTILGMRKQEIERKFDEIVAFAEIEKFIDTAVKHYSSGMYMRLAFSVAAHLEPEILLVDEVLAVGDSAFQKKCLGKMSDVAREGRTVLFVSHNMGAVQSLCRIVILLESGRVVAEGDSQSVVAHYLSKASEASSEATWTEEKAPGNEEVKLIAIRAYSNDGDVCGIYSSKKDIYVEIEFTSKTDNPALHIGFDLMTNDGITIVRTYHTDLPLENWPLIKVGKNKMHCKIPAGLLNAGCYYVCPRIGMHNMHWIINFDSAVRFEVVLDHGVSPLWNVLNGSNKPGVIAPIFTWDVAMPAANSEESVHG